MKILKVVDVGLPGTKHYLVEMPAERRIAFCSDYPDGRYEMVPLDLPLPPAIYLLRGPDEKYQKKVSCSMMGMWALDKEGGNQTYYLPLLNYYITGLFSVCSNHAFVPDHDNPLAIEDILSGIISFGWATPMRYFCGHGFEETWKWLGYPEDNPTVTTTTFRSRVYSQQAMPWWPKLYEKWEKLSLEEACKFPWGKTKMKYTRDSLIKSTPTSYY